MSQTHTHLRRVPDPVTLAIDSWAESLGTLCWAQDQSEQLVRSWMDQGKLAREQGREMARQLAGQAKKNQVELQKFIHNSVALSLETMQKNHQNQMAEMQSQVQQMTQLMATLQQKVDSIKE